MDAAQVRVLSVQSHVVHGYVGNKSAVLPLQVLGIEVDFVNSVQFSNHTGYGTFRGDVLDGDKLWDIVTGLQTNKLLNHSHLLTGYIGSPSLLRTILRTLAALREVRPDAIYVCDPVLGDNGKLYVPEDLVQIYREEVLPLATILTPNHFEAELLTDMSITTVDQAFAACAALHNQGVHTVVITSASLDASASEEMITLLASQRHAGAADGTTPADTRYRLDIPKIQGSYTGTGDLTAALILAWTHKLGMDHLAEALENVIASVQAVIRRTLHESGAGTELKLVQSVQDIMDPQVELKLKPLCQSEHAAVSGRSGSPSGVSG